MNEKASIGDVLREAILPEKVNFLGIQVDPAFYTAIGVSALLILFAVIFRLFIFPRFKTVPGKFQTAIEMVVGFFANLAEGNSPEFPAVIGAYAFGAGVYVFFGTCAELLGFRPVFVDINAGLAMGFCAFFLLLGAGIRRNGASGLISAAKEFSMPFSMAFRLFGALTSGLIATELIYSGFAVLKYSVVLPIFVGLMFTLLHAVMQTYVYTMLTSMFYGEVTEKHEKKKKKKKARKSSAEEQAA